MSPLGVACRRLSPRIVKFDKHIIVSDSENSCLNYRKIVGINLFSLSNTRSLSMYKGPRQAKKGADIYKQRIFKSVY